MFADLIGKTTEVYVDDMLVKSLKADDHVTHLDNTFRILKRYRMKLNPLKCAFSVASSKFLGTVLTREEGTTQLPVYYTSKALLSPKTRYPDMEKLVLTLITASRKLRPYFQAHTIHVLTNFLLRQVLQKPDGSGRLLKWAVELSEFNSLPIYSRWKRLWNLLSPPHGTFVDGSAGDTGSGARVVLVNPKGHKLNSTVRFGFKATNNAAEYEALLAGLILAKEMQVRRLCVNSDSQLVVSQVNGSFSAKDKIMASYLKMVMNFHPSFEKFEIMQIPRLENAHADALSKLGSSRDSELLAIVRIEHLLTPSTKASEAYKLRRRSTHFLFVDDVLYKRSFSSPLLRCMEGDKAAYILREVHEGVCGNHSRRIALTQKVLKQGYYWPTLKKDALKFVCKCDKCQRFSPI
ncbi:uncharacterized protein LOC111399949 [Olea europaea var. sylvestris]|uniref:uncharacterized protein LOC111399949 n=1 Tax=Olea europaea var. sylvestris TaxID=158386 RepID=UPI000C1D7598|nr:uncharacterized protein LOC111399949 [Olea europaea var. sylvestris]